MTPINTAISETWDKRGKWIMALICGISAGIGALIANIVLPHLVESTAMIAVIGGLLAGGSVLFGVVIFSLTQSMRRSAD